MRFGTQYKGMFGNPVGPAHFMAQPFEENILVSEFLQQMASPQTFRVNELIQQMHERYLSAHSDAIHNGLVWANEYHQQINALGPNTTTFSLADGEQVCLEFRIEDMEKLD